jgi:hypothetical protein
MRDYGKVHTSFWSSATTRALTDDGRTLAMYLLTSPHSTIAGAFRLPDGYACEDLQWTSERVVKGFVELLANGFANRCETTKWVWICKHLEWNPPENPNQRKSAAKIATSIPDECAWKADFMRLSANSLGIEQSNPCGTVAKPFLNQEQEQEQEQKKEEKHVRQAARFLEFWNLYPVKVGKKPCAAKWKSRKLDSIADAILADVRARIERDSRWRDGFVPNPETYLNQDRWDDGTVFSAQRETAKPDFMVGAI